LGFKETRCLAHHGANTIEYLIDLTLLRGCAFESRVEDAEQQSEPFREGGRRVHRHNPDWSFYASFIDGFNVFNNSSISFTNIYIIHTYKN
jgi:hypothetical protein